MSCVEDQGDDETIETQNLSENQDQNHTDKELGLLGGTSYSGIPYNTNSKSSSHSTEPYRETCSKVTEPIV